MDALTGKVLAVTFTLNGLNSGKMYGSKYFAGGYCIPNWAIEWVKEE